MPQLQKIITVMHLQIQPRPVTDDSLKEQPHSLPSMFKKLQDLTAQQRSHMLAHDVLLHLDYPWQIRVCGLFQAVVCDRPWLNLPPLAAQR